MPLTPGLAAAELASAAASLELEVDGAVGYQRQQHRSQRPGVGDGQRVLDRIPDVVGADGVAEVAVMDATSGRSVRVELVLRPRFSSTCTECPSTRRLWAN